MVLSSGQQPMLRWDLQRPGRRERLCFTMRLNHQPGKEKKRKTTEAVRAIPTSIKEKETSAQKAVSLPHLRVRGKLVWLWWVSGSMRPQGTRFMLSIFDFNGTSGRGSRKAQVTSYNG
eukprot:204279-Pelagomonas_calceolata.AAC.1